MGMITFTEGPNGITLPADSKSIGLWIKPQESQPLMSVWLVIQDSAGTVRTVPLGEVGELEWHRVGNDMPKDLTGPFDLMSISLYEPGTTTQSSGGGNAGNGAV